MLSEKILFCHNRNNLFFTFFFQRIKKALFTAIHTNAKNRCFPLARFTVSRQIYTEAPFLVENFWKIGLENTEKKKRKS